MTTDATSTWRADPAHGAEQPDDVILSVTGIGVTAVVRATELGDRFDGATTTVGVCLTADVWGLLAHLGVTAAAVTPHRLTVLCDRGRLVVQQYGPPTNGLAPLNKRAGVGNGVNRRDLLGWVSDPDPDGRLKRVVRRWVRHAVETGVRS